MSNNPNYETNAPENRNATNNQNKKKRKERSATEIQQLVLRIVLFFAPIVMSYFILRLDWLFLLEKILIVVFLVLLGVFFAFSLHVIEETQRAVIYTLGKYRRRSLFFFSGVRGPGIFFTIPFFESIKQIVDLRIDKRHIVAVEIPTKDGLRVAMEVDFLYRVNQEEPEKSVLEVKNLPEALDSAVNQAMKAIIGLYNYDFLKSEPDKLRDELEANVESLVIKWGIDIVQISPTDVVPPAMLDEELAEAAIQKYAAEGRMQAAQAEKEIAQNLAEASQIYSGSPGAQQLRLVLAQLEILAGDNKSTVVIPSELSNILKSPEITELMGTEPPE